MEIVPAIIPKTFEELKQKIKLVAPFCGWVQFDVMDGIFVPNKTWNNPAELLKLSKYKEKNKDLKIEAHLVISDIDKKIGDWLIAPIDRVIFHYEAALEYNLILRKIKNKGLASGLALNPNTLARVLENLDNELLDMVLIMTVDPGFAGQKFLEEPLSKINYIKSRWPNVKIGVDGGVNLDTAFYIKAAGPDYVAVGSYLWQAEDIKAAYFQLKKALN